MLTIGPKPIKLVAPPSPPPFSQKCASSRFEAEELGRRTFVIPSVVVIDRRSLFGNGAQVECRATRVEFFPGGAVTSRLTRLE
mgnify:CR=1 FL=1